MASLSSALCDVGPDGASERVTFGVMRLSHRTSSQSPQPMKPGQSEQIRVCLNHVGHRFKPGHRIRIALSTAYFPLIWPLEHQIRLAVLPETARIELPTLPIDETVQSVTLDAPRSPAPVPLRVHRGAESTRQVIHDQVDRSTQIEIIDDFANLNTLSMA